MRFDTKGIVLYIKELQENGCLIHCVTEDRGFISGFVNGMKTKKIKNAIGVGNLIHINYYGKENALGKVVPELIKSYTGCCIEDKLRLFMILCICQITHFMWGKHHSSHDDKNVQTSTVFNDIKLFFCQCVSIESNNNNVLIVQFIIMLKVLLTESGYGFNLLSCVATGEQNIDKLKFISPKSASAVSFDVAAKYPNVFLSLPKFFITHDVDSDVTANDLKNGIVIIDRFLNKVAKLYLFDPVPEMWNKTMKVVLQDVYNTK